MLFMRWLGYAVPWAGGRVLSLWIAVDSGGAAVPGARAAGMVGGTRLTADQPGSVPQRVGRRSMLNRANWRPASISVNGSWGASLADSGSITRR